MAPEDNRSEEIQDDEVIGRALGRSLMVLAAIAVLVAAGFLVQALLRPAPQEETRTDISLPQEREVAQEKLPTIPLQDLTRQAGIDWRHVNGMEGEKLLPETMGGGVAVFDYDRDGDADLLFVGGTTWEWSKKPEANPRSLCLFANEGDWQFRDVTAEAGLQANFYAMGPAVGDVDNDGWPDLFVSAVGSNRFYRNQQGKFVEQTTDSGLSGKPSAWSTGATWFDYDNDGLLDLFVCDYVLWSRELDLSLGFKLTGVGRAYGQPTLFTGSQSSLFHNEGGGKFRDVSQEMGIHVLNENTAVPVGKGLAVMAIDADQDGWQDLIVANDTVQNFLFMNMEGQRFEELGVSMGVAFDRSGNATGAMGIDCAFLRNDDSLAIAIGNFANEQSSLYMTRGALPSFTDQAMVTGLGPLSRLNLTFGMCFADLDLDGRQDLFCSNGHLEEEISKVQTTQRYAQPPQFFWNAGAGQSSEFVLLGELEVGSDALQPMVGRGAAYGDLDQDGDLDMILVANGGLPRVLRNDQSLGHHWLRLKLQGGDASNRDAFGARVRVRTNAASMTRWHTSTRSYLSQSEPELTFGLGDAQAIERVEVRWPSGHSEAFDVEIDRQHLIVEGEGVSL
ncbi:MAG: CRTAC1 family protein [bacterium]|nr:CRTAC1 family protein [bacterium]